MEPQYYGNQQPQQGYGQPQQGYGQPQQGFFGQAQAKAQQVYGQASQPNVQSNTSQKEEQAAPKFNDAWAAVLFIAHFIFMIVLAVKYGLPAAKNVDVETEVTEPDDHVKDFIISIAISLVLSLVVAYTLCKWLLKR